MPAFSLYLRVLAKVFLHLPKLKFYAFNERLHVTGLSTFVFFSSDNGEDPRDCCLDGTAVCKSCAHADKAKTLHFCRMIMPILMGRWQLLLMVALAYGVLGPVPDEHPENDNWTPRDSFGDVATTWHWWKPRHVQIHINDEINSFSLGGAAFPQQTRHPGSNEWKPSSANSKDFIGGSV